MVMKRLYQIKSESVYIDGEEFKVEGQGHLNRASKIRSMETDEVRDIGFAEWVETENLKKELVEEIEAIPDEEVWIVDEEAEQKDEKHEDKKEKSSFEKKSFFETKDELDEILEDTNKKEEE